MADPLEPVVTTAQAGTTLRQVDSGRHPTGASYWQIVRTSMLIGGSSIVQIALGLLRTKFIAVFLGPSGVGLFGTLTAVFDVARTLLGLGINSSGVREIASASASSDASRIARTSSALRKISWCLGISAAAMMILAAPMISKATFGTDTHTHSVVLLALAVLVRLVADAQEALLNGLRRISDIAKIAIASSALGAASTVLIVFWFGEKGIALAILVATVLAFSASWWYRRRLSIPLAKLSAIDLWRESQSLVKLGVSFMASAAIAVGAAYIVRISLLDSFGLEAVGLYQAAWAISGLYVGFILQAMGADFLPRLSAASESDVESTRIINEQASVSLLLAAPGVILTIALSSVALPILYATTFAAAAPMLQWFALGMALRVLIWPMSFILVARARQVLFFGSDFAWGICYVGLTWLLTPSFGPEGAGIAFAISYATYGVFIYPLIRKLISFRWSGTNLRLIALYLAAISFAFCAARALPTIWATVVGIVTGLLFLTFSLIGISRLVPADRLPRKVSRALAALRLIRHT